MENNNVLNVRELHNRGIVSKKCKNLVFVLCERESREDVKYFSDILSCLDFICDFPECARDFVVEVIDLEKSLGVAFNIPDFVNRACDLIEDPDVMSF